MPMECPVCIGYLAMAAFDGVVQENELIRLSWSSYNKLHGAEFFFEKQITAQEARQLPAFSRTRSCITLAYTFQLYQSNTQLLISTYIRKLLIHVSALVCHLYGKQHASFLNQLPCGTVVCGIFLYRLRRKHRCDVKYTVHILKAFKICTVVF